MAFGIGVSYYSISGRKYIKMDGCYYCYYYYYYYWLLVHINNGFRFLNSPGFIMKFRLYVINKYIYISSLSIYVSALLLLLLLHFVLSQHTYKQKRSLKIIIIKYTLLYMCCTYIYLFILKFIFIPKLNLYVVIHFEIINLQPKKNEK